MGEVGRHHKKAPSPQEAVCFSEASFVGYDRSDAACASFPSPDAATRLDAWIATISSLLVTVCSCALTLLALALVSIWISSFALRHLSAREEDVAID